MKNARRLWATEARGAGVRRPGRRSLTMQLDCCVQEYLSMSTRTEFPVDVKEALD